ncbi:terpenoid cyclases/protein prenyltransferase alpha-alpha toroid [Artemisia annua]|uniref:Terpenoid cyclases/protein prenyltransferase alpha-alpha toroid n=1 Tax=Artemisia annua TaxID=35608 RepID=A0A2U1Q342_ARTAN|nr:terpenoid cyclases/protein prenyltransferase alpha-alpha toroid [Artemisia annua]
MWKLKIAEGDGDKWLTTTNNHVGRQHWEFDPDAGTDEERAEIERVRLNFKVHRFQFKQSADLLMRIQVYTIKLNYLINLIVETSFLELYIVLYDRILVACKSPYETKTEWFIVPKNQIFGLVLVLGQNQPNQIKLCSKMSHMDLFTN